MQHTIRTQTFVIAEDQHEAEAIVIDTLLARMEEFEIEEIEADFEGTYRVEAWVYVEARDGEEAEDIVMSTLFAEQRIEDLECSRQEFDGSFNE